MSASYADLPAGTEIILNNGDACNVVGTILKNEKSWHRQKGVRVTVIRDLDPWTKTGRKKLRDRVEGPRPRATRPTAVLHLWIRTNNARSAARAVKLPRLVPQVKTRGAQLAGMSNNRPRRASKMKIATGMKEITIKKYQVR